MNYDPSEDYNNTSSGEAKKTDNTDIFTTQDYDASEPLREVSESEDDTQESDGTDVQTADNFDEEGNIVNDYNNNTIDDMSDES